MVIISITNIIEKDVPYVKIHEIIRILADDILILDNYCKGSLLRPLDENEVNKK